MTLEEAARNIGACVEYRAPHLSRCDVGSLGRILSVTPEWVFVRYGDFPGSPGQAAPPELLTLVNAPPTY